jgi:hypothetical protein
MQQRQAAKIFSASGAAGSADTRKKEGRGLLYLIAGA